MLKGLCAGYTYFKQDFTKYKRVARGKKKHNGGKEHYRSGAGDEGCAALCMCKM